jgi:hypothetical protein
MTNKMNSTFPNSDAAHLAELEAALEALGSRVAKIEARLVAADRRRAASAVANSARAARAAKRASLVADLARQLGWTDSGRRLTDRALVELIATLLAGQGISVGSSTVARDCRRLLGAPRQSHWTDRERGAAAAARARLRQA